MNKQIVIKLLFIVTVFGALGYFFGSQIPNQDKQNIVSNLNLTQPKEVLSEETKVPVPQEQKKVEIKNTDVAQNSTQESSDTLPLKEAFSKKYNKSIASIFVIIESKSGAYVKGSVDFDNSGYPATFYAAKKGDVYVIVAVENGVVPCTSISGFSFPSSMISQCYSSSAGAVISR